MSHPVKDIAIILAAGEGSRMKSALPKPLHQVGGRSLLGWSMNAALSLTSDLAVVVGAGAAKVAEAARAAQSGISVHEQAERRGTAHAVLAAQAALAAASGNAVILYADTPFIRSETLRRMVAARAAGADVVVLGFRAADPGGYGRLVIEDGALTAIVEAREASDEVLQIDLCNSGVVMAGAAQLLMLLADVGCENAKGEYYLTDIVAIARSQGLKAVVVECDEAETLGVNSRADLAAAEAAFQTRARTEAMAAGASLTAPETVWFSHDTKLGQDVVVEPFVVFGPGVSIASGATVRSHSNLAGCAVAEGAIIGPFARIRPGTRIGSDARVGNFVEMKNTRFGPGAKANHLAYVGDATVGAGANIGAGVITANYDGVFKYPTAIGDGAFIGSNSTLIAPVTIGAEALVAGGSVITTDVAAGALAVARASKAEKPGMAARLWSRLRAMKAAGTKTKGAL